MLLKTADNKESQLAILKNFLDHDKIPADKKQLIEKELRNMLVGIATEKQAAYEIDFGFESSKNLIVLHDLRLEINGRVAQIDHLLMNRAFDVYVLETKTFNTEVSINKMGEFSIIHNGREMGIPSPVEQNARHISVLKDAFKLIGLPTRLGITIQPSFHSVVLVSQQAVINRQQEDKSHKNIIKIDQFYSWYHEKLEHSSARDVIAILKVCSSKTIKSLGEKIVTMHKPCRIDYVKKFDLIDILSNKEAPLRSPAVSIEASEVVAAEVKEGGKYFCATCRKNIADVVAKFCWNNKTRFGGKAYCRACQFKF
ncbi:hypothetical protein AAKU55_001350 [Oxalobacteraceae bacterium GrIS 1.11]